MVGVINEKKLEKDFLDKVYEKAEQGFCKSVIDLETHREHILAYLKESWRNCLKKLGVKYHRLQDSGETGSLCYGYLSFLHSGILKQTDWYRMDYYDARDRISETECGEKLEVIHILKTFHQCTDEIRNLFASQARVKVHRADSILYQMAERFRAELDPLILESFHQVLAEDGSDLYGKLTLKFFMGDLFSGVELVAGWGDSVICIL